MHAAFLLRRARRSGGDARVIEQAREFALSLPVPVRLQVCVSLDGAATYVYAWLNLQMLNGYRARSAQRLAPLADWRGVSSAHEAPYHYVVASDIEPEWEAEFNRWYDAEHMPGLAAVPGMVHCYRLRSLDGEPQYHVCYDVVSPDVLEREEWCRMRSSAWSTRVRPHFVNTRRLMFRTVLDERRSRAFVESVF